MRWCTYCREETDVVLWVFDGVPDYPIPACAPCGERRRLKVSRVECDRELVVPESEDVRAQAVRSARTTAPGVSRTGTGQGAPGAPA
jgi:hypothetical protein